MSDTDNQPVSTPVRTAKVTSKDATFERVRPYLPSNYDLEVRDDGLYVTGIDRSGWTLDDYVLPRLASGLIFAQEVDV